jgi:DNA-binding LacI/PurR family transcriptional regulator/DNA-binding transcriptional regulator YhcF (GntR family)
MTIFEQLHVDPKAEIPLVAQLTQQITWLIASGELNQDDKLPPIRELAQVLGIHMHTVRSAYQRLEADTLVAVHPGRGTVVLPFDPKFISETRPNFPSFLFGVLIPNPVPVYQPYIEGIHHAARNSRWMPVVCYTGDNPLLTEKYIHQLIAKQVDGFIVTSISVTKSFENSVQIDQFPPVVFVDAPYIKHNSIFADVEGAAYQSTRHLLEHGHKKIALITAPLDWENVVPCYQGFQRALTENGISLESDLITEVPDFKPESGYEGARELLIREKSPSAVFITADGLAIGALQAFANSGVSVPGDMAITSFNNIEAAALVKPGLTTTTFPAYELGTLAVQRLQDILTGQEVEEGQTIVESQLVIRQSCGCP